MSVLAKDSRFFFNCSLSTNVPSGPLFEKKSLPSCFAMVSSPSERVDTNEVICSMMLWFWAFMASKESTCFLNLSVAPPQAAMPVRAMRAVAKYSNFLIV